jgi:hypothetical protein
MPRVNRDLQRRLEARRERERRRPSGERRYRFTTQAPPADAQSDGAAAEPAAEARTRAVEQPVERTPRLSMARPYASYARAYAYVLSDLRRVALIYGGLLLALIVLFLITQR